MLPVTNQRSKPRDIALDAVCCNGTIDCRCAASTDRVILPFGLFPPMIFVNRCFQLFFLQPSLFMKSMLLQQVLKDFHQEL